MVFYPRRTCGRRPLHAHKLSICPTQGRCNKRMIVHCGGNEPSRSDEASGGAAVIFVRYDMVCKETSFWLEAAVALASVGRRLGLSHHVNQAEPDRLCELGISCLSPTTEYLLN
ncbi:hypothetical protein FOZ63_003745 [Perkinsus olseni]|uniref:Uncharacterized protein n=1 Tax=Perkinsus olseni TaxID=32597 RepID=A0A7J6U512_PEROL|nr:hypothetical protein FOZ63_003745 [Perkinsus olseni]KAF4751781.1 hypothetical protein FOZ62_003378 [Perkinsus olseni]